ncbi:MAG: hypothetical protein NVS2B4_05110 [Ramlibacter sp.]
MALNGINAGRPWRLTLPEAIAALGTGRYFLEVEAAGERRRAELLGTGDTRRLYAQSPVHGDLLELLPDPSRTGDAAIAVTDPAAAPPATADNRTAA